MEKIYGPLTHTHEKCFELDIINYLEHTHNYEYVPPSSLKKSFDTNLAIDKERLLRFIESNAPEQYQEIVNHNAQNQLLADLSSAIGSRGIIDVLKKGFRFELNRIKSININLINANLNSPAAIEKERFKRNIFSVSNQVTYSTNKPRDEIDLVIFINGLPILTIELKSLNSTTKDNYKLAEKQYRQDRNPLVDESATLLQFGRCLVHFAVDEDIVEFTTKLQGERTKFMPFNKGREANGDIGAGNPLNTNDINGRKTTYLWEEIFAPRNLTRIIYSFAYTKEPANQLNQTNQFNKTNQIKPKRYADNNTLIFPRYHQYRAVTNLVKDVETNGVGGKYLIQHSAGSGKSNSISWLAYRLVEANYNNKRAFDLVIVITDRRNLDSQITNNIVNMLSERSVVKHADSSKKLKKLLKDGGIAISTIQKFTQIVKDLNRQENKGSDFNFKDKKFAIIIDEAHSSQSGKNSKNLNQVVSNNPFSDDTILNIVTSQAMPVNTSFFAFTATPKEKTRDAFGKVFDLYSMKQAIEEGFILDVLDNYTTYDCVYKIQKSIAESPVLDKTKVKSQISHLVKSADLTITAKSQIILERLLNFTIRQINGKAKAMLVTSSVDSAIKYYHKIKSLLKQYGFEYKCKVLIAFSGEHKDKNNHLVTESMLNGFSENKTAQEFKKSEYKLLIVANKYQTGYDEPLLHTMFVDKKISDVAAVQTLSRLNRICEGKNDTCVLDFCNTEDDIINSFARFYTKTIASSNLSLENLRVKLSLLRTYHVFTDQDLDSYTNTYLSNQTHINGILGICVDRFNHLNPQLQKDFRTEARAFIQMYNTLSSIIPIDKELEEEGKSWFKHALLVTDLLNRIASLYNSDEPEEQFHIADAIYLEKVYISEGTLLKNSLKNAHTSLDLNDSTETELNSLNSISQAEDSTDQNSLDLLTPSLFATVNQTKVKKDNKSSIDEIIIKYNEAFDKYIENKEQGRKDLDVVYKQIISNDVIRNTVKDYCIEIPDFLNPNKYSMGRDTLSTIEDGIRNTIKDPKTNLINSEFKEKYSKNMDFNQAINQKILLDIIQNLSTSVQEINDKLTNLGNNFSLMQ